MAQSLFPARQAVDTHEQTDGDVGGDMTDPVHYLVIDDDEVFNRLLVRGLNRRGFVAQGVLNAEDALALLAEKKFPRIVLDLNLNGQSGLALLPALIERSPASRILLLTGYASIATAVEAIKLGAHHYLAKPVEIEAIINALNGDDSAAGSHGHRSAGSSASEGDEHFVPLSVDRMEWEHIQRVLAENDGNISATARALRMHRRTLQRKLAKKPSNA